jgi:hypothetical protein
MQVIKSLSWLLVLLLPGSILAQKKTYLGFYLGPKFELYQSTDNGDALYTEPFFYSPIFGITLGQEVSENFILETGVFLNSYAESFKIEGDAALFGGSNGFFATQVPIRLKGRLDLASDRLSLVSTVGFTIAFHNDYSSLSRGGSFATSSDPQLNDSTRSDYMSRYNFQKVYGLIETGLALEYRLKSDIVLSLGANYLAGLGRVVEIDVEYQINDDPVQTGKVFSNGDYFSVFFGLKYPISNWWQDDDV